jgi:uncharacterized protein (DUF58 family)
MALTGRGWAVLVAAAASYALGFWAGYPLLRALGGAAAGAVVVAVLFTVSKPAVTIHRVVHPDRVERGKAALATLVVGNDRSRRQNGFTAIDAAGDDRRRVAIRSLPPGGEATYRYELPTSRRGRIAVGPLQLERADPLGLARSGRTAGDRATLWVHPRRHPVRTTRGSHPRHHHEGRTADESLRGSADLRDVREYVIGDEVRHLHWKATARTGQLMVRDYVDPDQPRLAVLLDDRAGMLSPELFEEAVEVAASILHASAMSGHITRLLTCSGLDVPTPGGAAAARQLLDALCVLEQSGGRDLQAVPQALSTARSMGGGLVVVSGTGGRAELAGIAGLRARHSVLAVLLLSDDATGAAGAALEGVQVLTAADAGQAVSLWNGAVAKVPG